MDVLDYWSLCLFSDYYYSSVLLGEDYMYLTIVSRH